MVPGTGGEKKCEISWFEALTLDTITYTHQPMTLFGEISLFHVIKLIAIDFTYF